MQKMMEKRKMARRNGGFSLVELIIVIAIMAALVAILAPQYIKYVEKSRISADETTADELLNTVKVIASDPDYTIPAPASGTTYEITWNADDAGSYVVNGGTDVDISDDASLVSAISDAVGVADITLDAADIPAKSTKYSDKTFTVTMTFTADNIVTVNGAWEA